MTSADDFHLFSFRNCLLLVGVCCAVMVPVALRRYSAAARTPLEEEVGRAGAVRLPDEERGGFHSEDDEDDDDELPRVSLREATRGSAGGGEREDVEGRAAYVARAWRGVEMDADVQSDGEGEGALSDADDGLLPTTFEDRREQSSRNRGAMGNNKARRVLGINGQSRRTGQDESYVGRMGNWFNSAVGRS